jgi:hypothetical protein
MQPITTISTQRRSFDDGGPRIVENARGTAHPYGFAGRRPARPAGFAQRLSGSSHAGGSTARTWPA